MTPTLTDQIPLAHSSTNPGEPGDPYSRHVIAVRRGARDRLQEVMRYATDPPADLLQTMETATTFHDLGKLDPDIQKVLRKGRKGGKLKWDHIDAGVAHLSAKQDWAGAWLVRAHHAPGLPENQEHFNPDKLGRCLRGRRHDDIDPIEHKQQIDRTNACLSQYIHDHEAVLGRQITSKRRPIHGLSLRLALSCLVDADHTDTAFFDTHRMPFDAPEPRWAERLHAMCCYVRTLPGGDTQAERHRNQRRTAFFDACLNAPIRASMAACEGPVGLGKTTAVTAYLLRRARDENLRRLIVVAPYTNILTQTAERLRKALVLRGERPDYVVVEHHHRADFEREEDRSLAVLWRAPIVLTTAVSFFEALSASDPASLRKLHSVPGSAVFIDEAHAALPAKLWPQNWKWLCELGDRWGCCFVFASGSLARFWENREIVDNPMRLPELLPKVQAEYVFAAERHRVRFSSTIPQVLDVNGLIQRVKAAPGPRLVILNTVQNAAVVAKTMRDVGLDVLHLSTALTPRDRGRILKQVGRRLKGVGKDWALVATSCVEAGVDFSFRTAFRERFATASIIQIGGRVNRHGEYDALGGGYVYDFALSGDGITQHPAAAVSAEILRHLMSTDELNHKNPADIVSESMRQELIALGGLGVDPLLKAEAARDYPAVKLHGRVIDADTRMVVVDHRIKRRLEKYQHVSFRALLRGSVQLWATKIEKLGLVPLQGRPDIYVWSDAYDSDFLGIMAGILRTAAFLGAGGGVI